MNKYFYILVILVFAALIVLLQKNLNKPLNYQTISPEAAKAILDGDNEALLIDVRTYEEYIGGHLSNSILIPLSQLEANIEEILKDKNQQLLIYCRTGNRSRTASKLLLNMGYKNVLDLGGIMDWPYEIITTHK